MDRSRWNNDTLKGVSDDLLRIDVYASSMEEINASLQLIDEEQRHRLLSMCSAVLEYPRFLTREFERVVFARIATLLLPGSMFVIEKILHRKESRIDYETHFSLFCYLDWVQVLPNQEQYRTKVLDLVSTYLRECPRFTARAAWMAGDLMGDHWRSSESVPHLMKLAREARYVAGRCGSLHGLGRAIVKAEIERHTRDQIIATIEEVISTDQSKIVKSAAKFVLRNKLPKTVD